MVLFQMGLREMGCEDGRWKEQVQDYVQWRALVLAVLNVCCYQMNERDKDNLIDSPSDKIHREDSPVIPVGHVHV
jgi:hypothetical protein